MNYRNDQTFEQLLQEARACKLCDKQLPCGAKPVIRGSASSRILILSQAPSLKAHEYDTPWYDMSGDRLRSWLGVDNETFYNPELMAIMPMGFCYPGRGKSGDLPPRKECAPLWHERFLSQWKELELIILVGQYAQKEYLGKSRKKNLTETVRNWQDYQPKYFPIVHPSPRNKIWMKKNPWFEEQVIPALQEKISRIVKS
jgi:uracil-DNA glycosylase